MGKHYIKVNEINICYDIVGNGVPLFLIHGYGGQKEDWFLQVQELKKYFKTICFDNRCTGKSDHPNEPITMRMFADDLKGLMVGLNIDKAHIAGKSLGGMIAQQFLLSYPDNVKKAILINTNYSGEMGEVIVRSTIESETNDKESSDELFWADAMFMFHNSFRRQLKKNPDKKFYNLFTLNDLIKNFEQRIKSKEDLINQGYAFNEFNTLNNLHKIENDILLIGASHDRILPNSQMHEMHEVLPNSKLKIIKKTGHGSTISRAPEINELMINFLKEK